MAGLRARPSDLSPTLRGKWWHDENTTPRVGLICGRPRNIAEKPPPKKSDLPSVTQSRRSSHRTPTEYRGPGNEQLEGRRSKSALPEGFPLLFFHDSSTRRNPRSSGPSREILRRHFFTMVLLEYMPSSPSIRISAANLYSPGRDGV